MYYNKWRDEFLVNFAKVFEKLEKYTERVTQENQRLKRLVGELTVELKKSEGLL